MEKNVIYIYMWMKVKVRDPKNDMQQHGWELELCSFENPAIIVKLLPSLTTTTWKNRMLAHQLEPLAPSKNGPPQLKLNWKMKPNLGHRRLIGTAGHTHPARQFPKFIDSVKTSADLSSLFRFQVHESGKEDKLGIVHKQAGDNLLEWQIQNALLLFWGYLWYVGRRKRTCKRKKEILHMFWLLTQPVATGDSYFCESFIRVTLRAAIHLKHHAGPALCGAHRACIQRQPR